MGASSAEALVPAVVDSVRSVVDDAGNVRQYVDPRSWTARGYEAITGAHDLYKEGVRHATEDIQYGSEEFQEKIDSAREKAGKVVDRISSVNPFG